MVKGINVNLENRATALRAKKQNSNKNNNDKLKLFEFFSKKKSHHNFVTRPTTNKL